MESAIKVKNLLIGATKFSSTKCTSFGREVKEKNGKLDSSESSRSQLDWF